MERRIGVCHCRVIFMHDSSFFISVKLILEKFQVMVDIWMQENSPGHCRRDFGTFIYRPVKVIVRNGVHDDYFWDDSFH